MALSYGSCVLFLNSVLFSSFIHAAPCTFSSLLLTIAQESMVCTHHILFMHFPEVRDLEGLPTFCPHKWCHREHLHTCALVGPGPGFLMIVAGSGIAGSQDTYKQVSSISSDYSPEWLLHFTLLSSSA